MYKAYLFLFLSVFSISSSVAQDYTEPVCLTNEKLPDLEEVNNIKFVRFARPSKNQTSSHTYYNISDLKLDKLTPSYLDLLSPDNHWKEGWFFSASGGVSTFIGDPIGCDDLFGRMKPTLQASAGKWFLPSVGSRIQYQGYELKSGLLETQQYHGIHFDLLLDIAGLWYKGNDTPLFSVIPYAGCGIILNSTADTHPFSIHFGMITSMKLTSQWRLDLELSGMKTFNDMDAAGCGCKLKDHLLNATLGLSYTIGNKYNRMRVIDALPYMKQNEELMAAMKDAMQQNSQLSSDISEMEKTIQEYRKILLLKGWLKKNRKTKPERNEENISPTYPYNNYNGLNALRKRLGKQKTEEQEDESPAVPDSIREAKNGLISGITNHSTCIGSPILFFFQLGTANLTDPSQKENLRLIAEVARQYDLKIKIIGAADSATGNEEINKKLAGLRSDCIESELISLGIPKERIRKRSAGGIDRYSPAQANRNTRIELYW